MNTELDLDQFEVRPSTKQQSTAIEPEARKGVPSFIPHTERDELSKFEVSKEGSIQSAARQAGQYGLRGLETFLGLPGAFSNLIEIGIEKGAEAIAGEKLPKLREFGQKFRETGKTPEYFREKGKQVFGETFEPKSESEESRGEIASDVGAFLNPVAGMMSPAKAIGLALVGKGAKETAKQFTRSEGKQDASKIGAMFVTDVLLTRGKGATKFIDNLYKTERSLVPQGAKANTADAAKSVQKVIDDLDKSSVSTSSSNLVRSKAEELMKDIGSGTSDVEGLLLGKKRLNEVRGDPAYLKNEEPMLNRLSNAVEDSLEDYGKTNPEFLQYHKNANEAYATMQQSKKVSNFIGKNLPKQASHFMLALFGEAITGHAAAIPYTIGAAAAVKTGELMYRVMASPTLRRYYLDVLRKAGSENAKGVASSISKLDKAMQKELGDLEEFQVQ